MTLADVIFSLFFYSHIQSSLKPIRFSTKFINKMINSFERIIDITKDQLWSQLFAIM